MSAFRFRQKRVAPEIDLLPPERVYRPMPRQGFAVAKDVIDASFVTVGDPVGDLQRKLREDLAAAGGGRASAGARPATRSAPFAARPSAGSGRLATIEARLGQVPERRFTSLVAALAVLVFLVAGGYSLFFPAPIPARAPLDLTHVAITARVTDGMPALLVTAVVENHGWGGRPLPAIRADLLVDGQMTASTIITPPFETLGEGESRGISVRLRNPTSGLPQVRLAFVRAPEDL